MVTIKHEQIETNMQINTNIMETKEKYTTPLIEIIQLDCEISLALTSAPPEGPDESDDDFFTSNFLNNNSDSKINI